MNIFRRIKDWLAEPAPEEVVTLPERTLTAHGQPLVQAPFPIEVRWANTGQQVPVIGSCFYSDGTLNVTISGRSHD